MLVLVLHQMNSIDACAFMQGDWPDLAADFRLSSWFFVSDREPVAYLANLPPSVDDVRLPA